MSAQANIHSRYKFRIMALALILIGWGAWSLWDGMVAYPAHNQHRAASLEAMAQYRETHGSLQGWPQHARENGFALDPTTLKAEGVTAQYVMAGLALPPGLALVGYFFVISRRWIRTDGEGLHTSWGRHAPWASLESVDKARWQRKGIAVIYYRDGDARRSITLDDWKYDTDATEQILAEVEAQVGEKISEKN